MLTRRRFTGLLAAAVAALPLPGWLTKLLNNFAHQPIRTFHWPGPSDWRVRVWKAGKLDLDYYWNEAGCRKFFETWRGSEAADEVVLERRERVNGDTIWWVEESLVRLPGYRFPWKVSFLEGKPPLEDLWT